MRPIEKFSTAVISAVSRAPPGQSSVEISATVSRKDAVAAKGNAAIRETASQLASDGTFGRPDGPLTIKTAISIKDAAITKAKVTIKEGDATSPSSASAT